jgi:hypothetical protein
MTKPSLRSKAFALAAPGHSNCAAPAAYVDMITGYTAGKFCYGARSTIAKQRSDGKAIRHLSIPLSGLEGGYKAVGATVAGATKGSAERRFGVCSVWVLTGSHYQRMRAGQILCL